MTTEIDDTREKEPERFTPSRYMRERRPYLFSDSIEVTKHDLTREVLSHHLETLTNQKQETVFEAFALGLAEKFISPNLRPQTGPTGGGDGKTDSETYPVAAEIAERWFVHDTAGAHERWAFAISAKKDWKGKVRSDVKGIVGTERDYPRIYFISNQFIPARESAAMQDDLFKKYGVPVTILDRTWLLDAVFDRDSMDIAVDTLKIGGETAQRTKKLGPRDFERSEELQALEKDIADGRKYNGKPHALADDTLQAALLARGLEKPRHEVEGLFHRAIRIARERGSQPQLVAALYALAWTSNFWFDDFSALTKLYDEIEPLVIDTESADEIERLTNLMPLISAAVKFGALTPESGKVDERVTRLTATLERLRQDTARPNNSLHAHALLLLGRLAGLKSLDDTNEIDALWKEFQQVVKDAHGLGTFPFETIADAITEIGAVVSESTAFDELYETITDALVERRSEGEAAQKNAQRASQKLDKGLPYDAIRWYGRAAGLLIKAEYEDDLVRVLHGSSIAYEQAGLHWAARNYALAAASQQFSAFKRTGSINTVSPAVLSRLFQTELVLGRVPNAISAYHLGMIIRQARSTTEQKIQLTERLRTQQGMLLGALLLRTRHADLPRLRKMPDALDHIALELPRMAMLFLMGHEDLLREEGTIPADETPEGYQEHFVRWHNGTVSLELPEPSYHLDDEVTLTSRVLGCELNATCANNLTSIGIGEAVVGAVEALLATSLAHRFLPNIERLQVRVKPVDGAALRPYLEFIDENGVTIGLITHAPKLVYSNREEALTFPDWLHDAVVQTFVRLVVPADIESWSKSVLGEERAFSRAVNFSNIPIMLGTIYGDQSRLSITDWSEDGDVEYEIKRTEPWQPKQPETTDRSKPPTFGEGDAPDGLFDLERIKHSDLRIMSPIDVQKWEEAKWNAAYFEFAPGSQDMPPVLGLAFKNREPAEAIFQAWRGRYGVVDGDNSLRVAIIRGIRISNPHSYAVVIGPDPMKGLSRSGTLVQMVQRINRMNPKSSRNLDAFLQEYHRYKRYLLVPAHLSDLAAPPEPLIDLALGKYELAVRQAWQISENDPDITALDPDDPPVIPLDQVNAPVLKALEKLAGRKKLRG